MGPRFCVAGRPRMARQVTENLALVRLCLLRFVFAWSQARRRANGDMRILAPDSEPAPVEGNPEKPECTHLS